MMNLQNCKQWLIQYSFEDLCDQQRPAKIEDKRIIQKENYWNESERWTINS